VGTWHYCADLWSRTDWIVVRSYGGAAWVEQILVTEPSAQRRRLAKQLGAQLVVDPSRGDATNDVRDATERREPDVVVDTVGHELPFAVDVVAKGGIILVFGLNDRPVTLNSPAGIVSREIRVRGVFIPRNTIPEAVRLLALHPELFRQVVTETHPFSSWPTAIDHLLAGSAAGKIVVQPSK
jgi:threonine dehydrogenase-like Zn-dependent dehydrogenase